MLKYRCTVRDCRLLKKIIDGIAIVRNEKHVYVN